MYLTIVFLPLFIYLFTSLFARLFGGMGVGFITTIGLVILFLFSCIAFLEVVLSNQVVTIDLFNWFVFEGFTLQWGFLFDSLTVAMLIIITLVSSAVHLYSMDYMKEDPHLARFMSYLTLFTFFMIVLVTSNSYMQLFVGWEGVGLVSYLLINFWHTRIQANKSALKAILVNRIGDFFFFFGMISTLVLFNSLNYEVVFMLVPSYAYHSFDLCLALGSFVQFNFEVHTLSFIAFLFLLGAVGKSAQLGLHTWLPDAMEGPTPVSALIHAATMVTAGVFLLLRSSPLLEYCPNILSLMVIFGSLTALLGASIGLFQNDLKKVIAYSTCSQLGYMVLACGVSAYNVSFYHLINHAFFKALLFLSAGCVIHSMLNEQDMRRMGGLRFLLPIPYTMILIGSLSLMGFPFLTGFYSKDALLEVVYSSSNPYSYFGYVLALITAMITAFYSGRLLYLTFLTAPNGYKRAYELCHESTDFMIISLCVLGLFSVFAGYLLKDVFIGLGSQAWLNSFGSDSYTIQPLLVAEFLPWHIKLLPVICSLISIFTCFFIYLALSSLNQSLVPLYVKPILGSTFAFITKKWYFDHIYNSFIVSGFFYTVYESFKRIDRGLFEYVGPTGFINYIYKFRNFVGYLQIGPIYVYLAHMTMGLVIFLALSYFLQELIDSIIFVGLVACLISLSVNKYILVGDNWSSLNEKNKIL